MPDVKGRPLPHSTVNPEALACLREIYLAETAGILRYLHYSFMIRGHNRIPIQKWFRDQANESQAHAILIGEKLTSLGDHPPTLTAPVQETNRHTVHDIRTESLEFEQEALELYRRLAALSENDIALNELARSFVRTETEHVDEVRKMLLSPER
jgi:bacterioferritin